MLNAKFEIYQQSLRFTGTNQSEWIQFENLSNQLYLRVTNASEPIPICPTSIAQA